MNLYDRGPRLHKGNRDIFYFDRSEKVFEKLLTVVFGKLSHLFYKHTYIKEALYLRWNEHRLSA